MYWSYCWIEQKTCSRSIISPEFLRTRSHCPPEKRSEMALVLEAESVGNLLDGEGGGQQQRLGLSDQAIRDVVARRSPRHLLHHIGDIDRRKVQRIGVPLDVVVLVTMQINQREKLPCQFFRAREWFLGGETIGMKFIKERRKRLDQLYYGCPPPLGFLLHQSLQKVKIVHDGLHACLVKLSGRTGVGVVYVVVV